MVEPTDVRASLPSGTSDPRSGGGGSDGVPVLAMVRGQVRAWSLRRWMVALVALPPLTAWYASFGSWPGAWWAVPSAVLSGALAAVVIASYAGEPSSGRLVDVGCSPCAVVAGAAVFGSAVLRESSPGDPGTAVVALLLLAFGLAQRLGGAGTCSVPR